VDMLGVSGIIISASATRSWFIEVVPISRLRNILPVTVVGDSISAFSSIGVGSRRRRRKRSWWDSLWMADTGIFISEGPVSFRISIVGS